MRVFPSIEALAACVGEEIGVSDWTEIDQDRINRFADATDDHQWIHTDVERAARELPGGRTIAHGFLTLSLLPVMAHQISVCEGVSRALNLGLGRVRFTSMVPSGSRIRGRQKIQSAERRAGGTQIVNEFMIEIEGLEKPACVAETIWLFFP